MGRYLTGDDAGPPRLATWLLERRLPADMAEALIGDLAESCRRHAVAHGPSSAHRWYWRETLFTLLTFRNQRIDAMTDRRHGDGLMTTLLADLQFAVRQLRRHPALAVLVVMTLALGIGATTAIFSAVDPILFAALPYPHPDQLVMFTQRDKQGRPDRIGFATIKDVAAANRSFSSLAAIGSWEPTLTGPSEPERLEGERVSWTYFRTLGIGPAIGRDFHADEDTPGAAPVVVLSNGLWRSRFGADPGLIGRTVTLNGTAFTVLGVMPHDFENLAGPQAQIWTPLRYDVSLPWACRTCHHLRAIARLKPGTTHAQALADLNAISTRLVADHPAEYAAAGMLAPTLADDVTGAARPALLAVLGAVVLLLLISCANVTNLMLSRAAQRQGEFTVRVALGAAQGRILRQLLTESVLLALVGGVVGIAVAIVGVRALVAIAPPGLPRVAAIHVNGTALIFTLGVATTVGLVFGLIPALQVSRGELHAGLKRSSRRAAGTRRLTLGTLVVAEVALALMLLIGSGLLLRTLARVLRTSPGFDASHLVTLQVQTSGPRFGNDTVTRAFFDRVLTAVRALPGVQAAAFTSQLPLSGDYDAYGVHPQSRTNANPETDPSGFRYAVSPGYLEAMKIALVRGRTLAPTDDANAPPVMVVNASFAGKLWPGQDPIGQRVRLGAADTGPWWTIVGIVNDVRQTSLAAEAADGVYVPEAQYPFADGAMSLVLRTTVDPATLIPAARRTIWSIDKDQPILRIATMEELVTATEAQRHFTMILFSVFALVALLLAAAGIYGVLSNSVTERGPEIGVRSALGASRASILWLIARQGAVLTGSGLVIGLAAAAVMSRFIASLVVGIDRIDVVTYTAVTAGLGLVAMLASWIPAWRATRVDPLVVLRGD